jgi:tetrahydrodipicolinate N-succinyltransferase
MTGTVLPMGAGMETRIRARTAAGATAGVQVGRGFIVAAGAAVMIGTVTRGDETGVGPQLHKDPTPLVAVVDADEETERIVNC